MARIARVVVSKHPLERKRMSVQRVAESHMVKEKMLFSTRIPQWESDAVSEGQTLRNEDNAFLLLSSGQISLLCEFCQSHKALCQAAERTLKQHTWVSSPLQVLPSLMFNCGIRVQCRAA